MAAVEFWFEFASTYSYPAAMRVERVAAEAGVDVVWRPFLLGPVFARQGLTDSPFNVFEAKGRYMWRDLERICAADGLRFQKPAVFPQNGLTAARLTLAGLDEGWGAAFARSVYQANFADGLPISDPDVLRTLVTKLDANADAAMERASSPEIKERLKVQTDRAWEKGVFGAPSFTVEDELFWGNDRMEAAFAWAKAPPAR
ncbi:MAG: 2-hydroxychromene-2-carboxylate isomerase [Parvibaculaceae bacterium]